MPGVLQSTVKKSEGYQGQKDQKDQKDQEHQTMRQQTTVTLTPRPTQQLTQLSQLPQLSQVAPRATPILALESMPALHNWLHTALQRSERQTATPRRTWEAQC